MGEKVHMFDKDLAPGVVFPIANALHHLTMKTPDLVQIIHSTGVHVEADRFISIPISFENAGHEWVIEAGIDEQMKFAMFLVGDLRRGGGKFAAGALDQGV
jgi:hypothetical protein